MWLPPPEEADSLLNIMGSCFFIPVIEANTKTSFFNFSKTSQVLVQTEVKDG
jgi:hypothetical protein